MEFACLRTLLVDGDGVIWRTTDLIPGALRLFDILRRRGIRWALVSNNNTHTVASFIQKLSGLGISADAGMIFSSSTATADYLLRQYGPGAPVHAVGMEGVVKTLEDAGFLVSHGEKTPSYPVVAVVAGMDRAITHEKIKTAMRLIMGGAAFIATNLDPNYPAPDGLNPGTGMVIGALQAVTGVTPVVIGKPERYVFDSAIRGLGADPATTVMLGDRLDTDILGAQRAGIRTIAVLTGIVTRDELATSPIQPDSVYESVAELADALEVF
jgi:4-nitrophenyl phosphatase